MIQLILKDRKRNPLNFGDLVKVSNGSHFNFFARVTYLEKEKAIAPFHTFSFHSFEKVERVPDNAVKSTQTQYDVWYTPGGESEQERDENAKHYERYLIEWRECEHLLSMFDIVVS